MQQLGLWSPDKAAAAATAAAATGGEANGTAAAANGCDQPQQQQQLKALDVPGVVAYIEARPDLAVKVGPPGSSSSWEVDEVGDGNINFVFIIKGPSGGLCMKQSLPFVRCVGESWPLSTDRCRIEAEALIEERKHCPQHVPEVFLYDSEKAVIVMEYVAPPAKILRHGIVAGEIYPKVAQHTGVFLAETLFKTSLLALDSRAFKAQVVKYVNPDLCALTEQVIFTDPYTTAPLNR